MTKVASLHYDVIFKKAFSKPHIFTAFVKDMLGIDIEIDRVETEKSFSPIVGKVNSRFDLFAEDKKNRFIVDIQHKRYADHYDRFLHYHFIALLEQVADSSNYKPPMDVYTIVVLTSGDKHKTDISVTDFRPQDLKGNYIAETKHKIIYICPKYLNDETPKPYRKWLEIIDDSLDEKIIEKDYDNEIIREIISTIKKDKITPKEYAKMKQEYSDEEYMRDEKQKAEQKGARERDIEIAKNLLDVLDIETIALKTGLSIEEIKNLK